ncbi:MAG: hypothetical protein ABIO49_15080 [Dokdonella sp.]
MLRIRTRHIDGRTIDKGQLADGEARTHFAGDGDQHGSTRDAGDTAVTGTRLSRTQASNATGEGLVRTSFRAPSKIQTYGTLAQVV